MLIDISGNLLTSDCNIMLHQVNSCGKFASGIAGQIREMFPQVYLDYMTAYRNGRLTLGNIVITYLPKLTFVSMCAQATYGRTGKHTNEEAFRLCCNRVKLLIDSTPGKKVGVPCGIGCGLGGASWSVIRNIIDEVFRENTIHIYKK